MRFENREDAGRQLARDLEKHRHKHVLVLGLPGGGVPVAFEVAAALSASLGVWVVKKIGAPAEPELGIGAVAEGGVVHCDRKSPFWGSASEADIDLAIAQNTREVEERVDLYRRGAPPPDVRGRTVIVVDDGIATGGTMRAVLEALRARGPERIVLAVPVATTSTLDDLRSSFDEVHCLIETNRMWAIGAWYSDFARTTDEEILELLDLARSANSCSSRPPPPTWDSEAAPDSEICILVGSAVLCGTLSIPHDPRGLVIFAQGSGSSRYSPRNRHIASKLRKRGMGTVLFDLLTREEEDGQGRPADLRLDIEFLAQRLLGITDWARRDQATRDLEIAYFAASTGAAAALVAASRRPDVVRAIVSRGGHPDLARSHLPRVKAPTLLIVGARDEAVLARNAKVLDELLVPFKLHVVPRATDRFEEPGALDEVSAEAADWFDCHFPTARSGTRSQLAEAKVFQ